MAPERPDHPGVLARVRRRLTWGSTRRMLLRLQPRVDTHAGSLRRLAARQKETRQAAAADRKVVQRLTRRLDAMNERLKQTEWTLRMREREYTLREVQFGAVEERLNRIEQTIEAGTFVASTDDTVEARRLIDEVRAEHARARARLQAVATYEERLRRVEESVAEMYDGDDLRQMV